MELRVYIKLGTETTKPFTIERESSAFENFFFIYFLMIFSIKKKKKNQN